MVAAKPPVLSLAVLLILAACGADAKTRGADSGEQHEDDDAGEEPSADADGPSERDAGGASERDAGPSQNQGDAGTPARGSSIYFKQGAFFTENVYDASKSAQSDKAIAALKSRGGFGNGGVFQID